MSATVNAAGWIYQGPAANSCPGLTRENGIWKKVAAPEGTVACFLQNDCRIYQTLNVPEAGTYRMTFFYGARDNYSYGRIHAEIDGTAIGNVDVDEVLSERSQRLKVLVEDLVEASKASSGAIQMNIERINLRELTAQVAGEMAESFEKADLDFKIILPELPVMINADGIKTCRIIENLLSNASKYSATGSRVYLTLTRDAEYGVLEIKNISATELSIPAEELMERFVRGDSSRTDGGSGLGLSIANNLAALQGGNLQLIIDGDLFKAILRLPLCGE